MALRCSFVFLVSRWQEAEAILVKSLGGRLPFSQPFVLSLLKLGGLLQLMASSFILLDDSINVSLKIVSGLPGLVVLDESSLQKVWFFLWLSLKVSTSLTTLLASSKVDFWVSSSSWSFFNPVLLDNT